MPRGMIVAVQLTPAWPLVKAKPDSLIMQLAETVLKLGKDEFTGRTI